MVQQALAFRRGVGTELQPVGHTLLAHFALGPLHPDDYSNSLHSSPS